MWAISKNLFPYVGNPCTSVPNKVHQDGYVYCYLSKAQLGHFSTLETRNRTVLVTTFGKIYFMEISTQCNDFSEKKEETVLTPVPSPSVFLLLK